jgi:YaiO family outer membrane protein
MFFFFRVSFLNFIFSLFCCLHFCAAQDFVDSTSYEGMLGRARDLAYKGERSLAKKKCFNMLAQSDDADPAVLLGRIYSWEGHYDSARAVLTNVLKQHPVYYDAVDALVDIEFWTAHYNQSLLYCDLVLEQQAMDANFVIKKAKIFNAQNRKEEAIKILQHLLKSEQENAEAKALLHDIKAGRNLNKLGITYNYDYFVDDNRDPWSLVSAQYSRACAFGSLIGRLNYVKRFNATGTQFELDAYPSLGKRSYAYLNYGYSAAAIFPEHRISADYYYNFKRAYEGSMGFRYMDFSGTRVLIYTAFVGKYKGDYWLSFRTFITPGMAGTAISGSLLVRKYLNDIDNYIGIRLGYGKSPDDRRKQEEGQALFLTSQSLRIEYSKNMRNFMNHYSERS